MHSLEGPRAKIERTGYQIKALDDGIKNFYRAHPYRVVPAEFNREASTHTLRIADFQEPPLLGCSILVGEIVHNFNLNSRPIAPLKRRFRTRIKRLQPYFRRNGQRRSPLWMLHELNNMDKHRRIPIVMASVGSMGIQGPPLRPGSGDGFTLGPMRMKIGVPLKNGTYVGFAHSSYIEMDVKFKVGAEVAFGKGAGVVERKYVVRRELRHKYGPSCR